MSVGDAVNYNHWEIPKTVKEAKERLAKYESVSSASDRQVADSVASHALQESHPLADERWLGTVDEEKEW